VTDNTNEAELLRMLGRWQDLALELGFAAGTGPAEIGRKVAALAAAAEHMLAFRPSGNLAADTSDASRRRDTLRAALAAYRGARRQPELDDSRRTVAEVLAAEHAATVATSAKLAERIAALDAREADEHGPD
jgi:hypothetical protein